MKTKVFQMLAVLFIGIGIGSMLASYAEESHLGARLNAEFLNDTEYIEQPDVLEHGTVVVESKIGNDIATSTIVSETYRPVGSASATSSPRSLHLPTLVYHSVRPHIVGESKYQDVYDVTPELLEQELIYLRDNGYQTIDYRDVLAYWDGATTTFPAKSVILTFDDGWRNEYAYAFPLLTKYHMKGVFYIFSNPIDHHKVHWVTWAEVREMDKAGMEIGGHTRTHPILTRMTSDARLDHEILDEKKILERELGHPIVSFAYPFGAKNPQVVRAVERAGYRAARTVYSGVWNDPEHRYDFHGTLSTDKIADFEKLLKREY